MKMLPAMGFLVSAAWHRWDLGVRRHYCSWGFPFLEDSVHLLETVVTIQRFSAESRMSRHDVFRRTRQFTLGPSR